MNDQELMLFAYQQSAEPMIKNKVLRDALDKDLGPRNMAQGGRIGFDKGGPLTGEKFKEIVTKYPDMTNQELLNYLNKNKFTNRSGDPLTTGAIKTQKSKFFDIAAEVKSQTPKGYISSTEVFENLPISKKDYFRVKQAKEGGTLLTKEIDKLLKPIKIGDTFYFKNPGKNDSKSFSRLADKTGRLNNKIADLMLDFDTAYGAKFFSKGNVPDIDDVAKKFNITDSTAGKVTTRLAQWYGGQDFKNPQLKDLKRNKVTSNRLFKTLEKSGFGNPYRQGLYQVAMQTIDVKLGNKQGTFEKFKSQARQILKDNKIPVYNPAKGKDAFGFNINEIAGVTGSAKSKAAEFSQFVDVMEGNINTKAMAGFQSKLSTARAAIEKDPTKLSVESKKINKIAKNLEKTYGVQLPRLRDPDATKFFSPTRLKELNAQGLDIVKAAERAGYTIEMPKGATTINEFVNDSKKQIKVLKKMGFRCNKAVGGVEDVACYLDDVKKTKADARSSDVLKRAKALTKERKALQVAKTLPKVGNIIRKGVQVGAGAVSSVLSAVGLGPVGFAIEAAIEGGFYDNARRNGYTHEQAYAETFLPKLITDKAGITNTGTSLFEGAESMIEKEKLGKKDSLASQFNNAQNIFDQEVKKLDNMVSSYMQMQASGMNKKETDAFLEKIYVQEDKVTNLIRTIKPGTPEYEAYQIAEETQTGRMENRKNEYLSMNRIPYIDAQGNMQEKTFPLSPAQIKQQEPSEFTIKQKDKERNKAMEEYKLGIDGVLEPVFLKENEKADWSKIYGDGPDQSSKKWKDIFEGDGAFDLTDKIGIAGGVANMAQGGLASLKKKL